jgi:hypothetical protein
VLASRPGDARFERSRDEAAAAALKKMAVVGWLDCGLSRSLSPAIMTGLRRAERMPPCSAASRAPLRSARAARRRGRPGPGLRAAVNRRLLGFEAFDQRWGFQLTTYAHRSSRHWRWRRWRRGLNRRSLGFPVGTGLIAFDFEGVDGGAGGGGGGGGGAADTTKASMSGTAGPAGTALCYSHRRKAPNRRPAQCVSIDKMLEPRRPRHSGQSSLRTVGLPVSQASSRCTLNSLLQPWHRQTTSDGNRARIFTSGDSHDGSRRRFLTGRALYLSASPGGVSGTASRTVLPATAVCHSLQHLGQNSAATPLDFVRTHTTVSSQCSHR